jgi:hypothetical protein
MNFPPLRKEGVGNARRGSPRPACGERSDRIADAIRVRGTLNESNSRSEPLTPPSPREERGEGAHRRCRDIEPQSIYLQSQTHLRAPRRDASGLLQEI